MALSKSEKLQPEPTLSELDRLLRIAADCDRDAVSLAQNTRALYDGVLARRAANGRGPSGATLFQSLQRCAAQHFVGTVLKMTRGPHPSHKSFKSQLEGWLPSLSSPAVLQPVQPPSDKAA
jgi:hypothetical protein